MDKPYTMLYNQYEGEQEELDFKLRMSGMGVVKIAKLLNDKGILSKNRRRYERGELKVLNFSVFSFFFDLLY